MGEKGKPRRWKISFHRSPAAGGKKEPPQEFICPISNSLMFDPVVVTSGHTFERLCVNVCQDLGFVPPLPDGSKPDFSTIIPNLALKTTISNWCKSNRLEFPKAPAYSEIEIGIRAVMDLKQDLGICGSERELLAGVAETPPVLFSHAATELNPRNMYASSSSDESVIANTTPLLRFATRPACLSNSSPSDSMEFLHSEGEAEFLNHSSNSPSEDENFVVKMRSPDVIDQEEAVISLRKTTKNSEAARTALCSDRVLQSLKRLLLSRYSVLQTNATAVVVNLSLQKANKIKMMRAGIVPLLIDILKNGFEESREHAAGAIFSLALEDDNKTAIGVLGALEPLLHELRCGARRSRHDAALALYHLTLVQINRAKIVKLGAASVFLGLMKDAEVAARVILVLCNVAACDEGRAALLDAGGVKCLTEALMNKAELESESTRENCVTALHLMSLGSLRFKGLARDAGTTEVLVAVAENGSERAREKAKRILEVLREASAEEEADDEEEVDWEAVMKGDMTRARPRRVGRRNSV